MLWSVKHAKTFSKGLFYHYACDFYIQTWNICRLLYKTQGTRQRPRRYNTGLNTVTVTTVNCLQTHSSCAFIVQLVDHQELRGKISACLESRFLWFRVHNTRCANYSIMGIAELQQAYLNPCTSTTHIFVDSAKSQKLLFK